MPFIEETIQVIKNAKTDEDIKKALFEVYVATQIDNKIREEFNKLFDEVR